MGTKLQKPEEPSWPTHLIEVPSEVQGVTILLTIYELFAELLRGGQPDEVK